MLIAGTAGEELRTESMALFPCLGAIFRLDHILKNQKVLPLAKNHIFGIGVATVHGR